ncbi:MAG: exodeoxyribonuclease VII small subunit [Candidatus Thiodiazotropha sp. (ex Dulcina madagascariensis)]|nr:exodeoxyribonuclease VII small subunit [Candidatus Thiodiazotropha sp. (ex Epidulcina cf. delphinae)]MCU7935735.1 exodeoxyribonuclease VII small subunit [Candidatus Thiodiazotropha sp. (ex Dulcina madagascariensis)]
MTVKRNVPKKQKTPAFEEALRELETLVESLEQGDQSLEESLKAFERGVTLTRVCQEALQAAEQKVRILNGDAQTSDLEPFSDDNE